MFFCLSYEVVTTKTNLCVLVLCASMCIFLCVSVCVFYFVYKHAFEFYECTLFVLCITCLCKCVCMCEREWTCLLYVHVQTSRISVQSGHPNHLLLNFFFLRNRSEFATTHFTGWSSVCCLATSV